MPSRSAQQQAQQQGQGAGAAMPPPQLPATFLWTWVGRSLLALLAVRSIWFLCNGDATTTTTTTHHDARSSSSGSSGSSAAFEQRNAAAHPKQFFYFYNEATGQVQWEDPGEVPFEEEDGTRYWLTPDGSKSYVDPGVGKYTWAEQYSADLQRAYFFNQETRESSWERPADLSWRRVLVQDED